MLTPTVVRNPRPDPGDSSVDQGERVRLLVVEPTPLVALAWAGRLDALLSAELLISDLAQQDAAVTPEADNSTLIGRALSGPKIGVGRS